MGVGNADHGELRSTRERISSFLSFAARGNLATWIGRWKTHPGFIDLALIPFERRPRFRARDQFFQMTQELASIAHAQGECIFPGKESLKLAAEVCILEDRTSPASTGA